MQSPKFLKMIVGPVGGGKSTVALMTMWALSVLQAPHNGVRRTKWVVLRNTMAQLKSTVKPLIDQWFVTTPEVPLGNWRLSDNTFEVIAQLPDQTTVHAEFCLMPADTPDDVRRLLSLECSGAWVEECREVDPSVFEALQGRTDRFPNRKNGGVTHPCVLLSTNPPPIGTYWHGLMEHPPENMGLFIQPPALLEDGHLNPDAENLANLSPTYYENLVVGKTAGWVDVYLRNKYGSGGFGEPVFKGTYREDFHHMKEPLRAISAAMKSIVVGSDNGLTAAAVIGQEDAMGRINVLDEAFVPAGETMGYDRFLDTLLIPRIRDLGVRHEHVLFVVDPACFQRSQANEVTIAQVIAQRGFKVVPAMTNDPERRIAAVEGLLMRQIDGAPLLRLSSKVKHLSAALDWGYRNRKTAAGQATATPEKNHFSHISDGFQCLCLHFNPQYARDVNRARVREVKPAEFAYS